MRRTAILMLVLSLLLGGLAVYLARDWVQEQVSAAKQVESKKVNLTKVVVAKRPLYFGDELGGSVVEEIDWPANNVPPGSFSNVGELIGGGERRVVLKTIQLNEPILKSKVSGFGGRATLSTVIDTEKRAITIRVNDVNGVAGFVLPGDNVDVLLTRQPTGGNEQITDVLMQNMRVLGIDQDASEDKDKPKVVRAVTLEVTTEQSQKLTLAQMVGQLSLALRSATNKEPVAHRRIHVRDLVDDRVIRDNAVSADVKKEPVKRVVRTPPPQTRTSVRVYRGLEPKIHEVTPEAASRRRITGTMENSGPPRRLVPKDGSGSNPAETTAGSVRPTPPVSSGPVPLTPDASKLKPAPTGEPIKKPKDSDSMVDTGSPIPVVLLGGMAR